MVERTVKVCMLLEIYVVWWSGETQTNVARWDSDDFLEEEFGKKMLPVRRERGRLC